MVRELQTLAVTLDHLLGGRLPQATNTLLQRYKACEMFLWDGNWVTARHLEIIPPSMASLVRSEEREMTARQELKAVGEPVQSRKRLAVRQRVRPTLGETCEPSEKKSPDRHLEWPLWATAWKFAETPLGAGCEEPESHAAAPVASCDWGHGRSDIQRQKYKDDPGEWRFRKICWLHFTSSSWGTCCAVCWGD